MSLTSSSVNPTSTLCYVPVSTIGASVSYALGYPNAPGAECYLEYPTGGGIEELPTTISDLESTPTLIPTSTPTGTDVTSTPSTTSQSVSSRVLIGPIVGTLGGIMILIIIFLGLAYMRQRQRASRMKKHEWANLKPQKWVVQKPGFEDLSQWDKELKKNLHDAYYT